MMAAKQNRLGKYSNPVKVDLKVIVDLERISVWVSALFKAGSLHMVSNIVLA